MPSTHRLATVPPPQPLDDENARLIARVRELEHLLQLERSRNLGLERGLSALSQRTVALRKKTGPLDAA
jgi:hypothetical protein